jgi:hypothetical protein
MAARIGTSAAAMLGSRAMNSQARVLGAGAALALALMGAGCGGAVQSGVAVGRVGRGLGAQARTAPQGAEVCALQESLAALPGTEKPMSEACGKAARSDLLWRRTMAVLAAYGQTLETLASGSGTVNAGKLEAALTGVGGGDSLAADGAAEQAARDGAVKLVQQMSSGSAGGDLSRAIKDAAPHVKAICEGLTTYLETTAKGFGEVEKEAEKKRASRGDRRCGSVSGANVCVGESPIDRMVYGNVFAQAGLLEATHLETRDSVASFCAAHRKAEQAANDGNLGKDQTYVDIVDAVKAAQRAPAAEAKATAKPPKK